MLTLSFLAAAASLAPTAVPAPAAADAFAIRAKMVHVGDGTSIENGVVVVTNGTITRVGTAAPEGVTLIEVDGHVSPGLIGLRDATGVGSENNETTRKLTPDADVSRAFDPHHPGWRRLVEQGVTAVAITPGSSRIAGGTAALVSPATGEILVSRAMVCLGMSSSSISSSVEPTSYAGLYGMLEEAFEAAAADSALGMAKAGRMPVLMRARSRAEVVNAASFAKEKGLKGAIHGASRAGETVDVLKDTGLAVVFDNFRIGAQLRMARSGKALADAGVPFAFVTDATSSGPSAMRMTAAAFQRAGVAPQAVLSAMTRNAADIAGVGATHGTLAAGKSADLVVWSGMPTDLTSRVEHVFAAGRHVLDATSAEGATR